MSFLRRFNLPSGSYYDDVYVVVTPEEEAIEYSIESYEDMEDNILEEMYSYDSIWNTQDKKELEDLIKQEPQPLGAERDV